MTDSNTADVLVQTTLCQSVMHLQSGADFPLDHRIRKFHVKKTMLASDDFPGGNASMSLAEVVLVIPVLSISLRSDSGCFTELSTFSLFA